MNTIKVKYGLEDITSRIPGLFPYLEFDENHVSTVHSASDSNVGCYGKIVCALTMPNNVYLEFTYEDEDGEGQPITIKKNVIFGGMSYNYRTLISAYYKYKDEFPDNSFIRFMEGGIGKIKLPYREEWTLVPEYEYYANCARLWDEYTKISIMCAKYQQMKELTGEINCELECLVEKYAKMGGDDMKEWYGNKVSEAKDIANEYLDYVSNDFYLDFNVNITASDNDLGILNTFVQFFGEKYVNSLYFKDDIRVVRIVREVDPSDPTHQRSQDTMTVDAVYYLDDTCLVEAVRGVDYFLPGDFVIYNDRTYVCEQPTLNGVWDSNRFHLISENYLDQTTDNKFYYNPEVEQPYEPELNLSGTVDSHLSGFIGDKNYIDAGGSIRIPDDNTTRVSNYLWLWYYHIGDVGFSETVTDRFNNIEIQSGYERVETIGQYETHLMAYGDIITDIRRDNDVDRTLTFEYYIGAHFKAKLVDIKTDDDGNKHYYYGEYEYDPDDEHGVFHVETYRYKLGGEINLMDDDRFEKYVTYDNNGQSRRLVSDTYVKGEFDTYQNKAWATRLVNGEEFLYPYIISDYTTPLQMEKDSLVNPLTKIDYLNGIVYKPTVESDVHISRGNAAAWERHMKLGELKTFDDLENYSNGGFFNIR